MLIQRFLIFFEFLLTEMKSFRSRVDRAKGDASEKILVKVQNDKDTVPTRNSDIFVRPKKV